MFATTLESRGEPEPAIRPGEIWLDDQGVAINAHGGGMLEHEGVYYWFGEHKVEGPLGNLALVGVHVYASKDLLHWRDAGIALPVSGDYKSEIAPGCVIERPKVIYNRFTGKFVMWFHLELRGRNYTAARAGVAVADKPAGPYRYIGSMRPNAGVWPMNISNDEHRLLTDEEKQMVGSKKFNGGWIPEDFEPLIWRRDFEGGQMARDMNLFVDDDGTAWHIYASEENSTLHISQLSPDYLKPTGRYARVFPRQFREAPAVLKHGGRYYLFTSGCTGWTPNPLRVAVANHMTGPWQDIGNPCKGTEEEAATTFSSQPTFVLPVRGKKYSYIFIADRWCPQNAIDGRYVWLPLEFVNGKPVITWHDSWHP